jgi:hypothetical protein
MVVLFPNLDGFMMASGSDSRNVSALDFVLVPEEG